MKWAFPIATVKGIKIQVHATFALVLIWAAISWGTSRGLGLTGALYGVAFISLLFLCVTLHELGHSLVAIHHGLKVRDITLLPIGGVARLEGELKRPIQEFWVAIAGPAVNLVIAAALGAVAVPLLGWRALGGLDLVLDSLNTLGLEKLLADLLTANLGLAFFNLLPAFPMDGGRVLRALLASRMGKLNATRIAMRVGQGLAVILGLIGIATGALNLALIAMFIFSGANQEWMGTQLQEALKGVPASAALVSGGVTASPDAPLGQAIDTTLRTGQADFAVFDGGYLVGILTRQDVADGFQRYGANVPIRRVMQTDFPVAQAGDTLLTLQHKMESSGTSAISIIDGTRFLGLATLESVQNTLRHVLSRRSQFGQA
jgi:Zn-dependent protease/CBS domain-containing protein